MIFQSLHRRLCARRRPTASLFPITLSPVPQPSHAELRGAQESCVREGRAQESCIPESCIPESRFRKALTGLRPVQRAGQCVAASVAAAMFLSGGVAHAGQSMFYAHADGQVTTFGSGVNNAKGTAVDANGNVYIANANGAVYKETYNSANNTYTQSTLTLSPALTAANGIAVDSSGNLYLSTGAGDTVVKYTGSGTTYTAAHTFGPYTGQVTAAVDGSGDVFIADSGTETLYEAAYSGGTYATALPIATGFSKPNYLAVNPAGTAIYVSDNGNTAIYKVALSGGVYTALTFAGTPPDNVQGIAVDPAGDLYIQGGSSVFEAALSGSTYTASVVYPYAGQSLALDGAGNLYLGASNQASETKLTASPSFGSVPVATAATEIPVTFTIDVPFTLGTPTVLTQGQAGYDFTLDTGAGTTCTAGTALAANTTCTVYVAFNPTAPGLRLGAVNLYDGTTLVATTLISGIGTGPLALFQPGVLNFTYTTGLQLGRGLALDPAGNVYLSDQTAGTVLKFAKNSNSSTTLFGNNAAVCSAPSGVAVDGAGNVFFGCEAPNKLYEIVGGVAGSTPVVIDSNVQVDDNLSVDGAGNLYTSEQGGGSNGISGTIYKYAAGTFVRTTLYAPASNNTHRFIGMALDANGNLFAVDYIGGQLYELPAGTSGILITLTNNSGLSQPHALGVDPAGNIYVGLYTGDTLYRFAVGNYSGTPATLTAQSGQAIAIDNKTGTIFSVVDSNKLLAYSRIVNPTLSFPNTAVGATSSAATDPATGSNDNPVVLENDGNANLVFPVPAIGNSDISVAANFGFGSSTTCPELTGSSSAPVNLPPGASCAAYYVFTPTQAGSLSGQASAIDNSLNAANATQLVTLNGTGTAETPSVTVFPTATPYGSASKTLSATISYGGVQPAGAVTFTVDTGASVPGTCTVVTSTSESCTASYPTGSLSFASHTIKASLAVDPNGNYSAASGTASLTITKGIPAIAVNSPAAFAGSNVTLTATITYGGPTAPLGAVTFKVGSGTTMTATNCSAGGGTKTCSVSYPTTALSTGSNAVTVNLATDTDYLAASNTGATVTVVPSSYTAPTEPVGTTSATQTATLLFPNGATLGAINVLTQGISGLDYKFVVGGSCVVGTAYTAGQSCTVLYTFTPTTPGPRYGAITLYDNSATPVLLSTEYLNGIGTGPLVGFAGGAQTTITSNIAGGDAGNIAIDAAGNLYIADYTNKRILKETVSGSSYTESSIGTGFSEANGIAVDGAGNLYVSDQTNNAIYKETLNNGAYTQSTVISSGLNSPIAVAVDGAGNLFIANEDAPTVLKETPSGGTYTATTVATLSAPSGVAVDGKGLVYIIDKGSNSAYIATPSGSTYNTAVLTTGLNFPLGITVDGGGNVYIGDGQNNRLLKETLSNGVYTQTTLGTGLNFDQGVGIDAQGNIYVVDSGNNRVIKIDVADAPALAFGSVAYGSSSTAQSDTLQNNGNASLTFASLAAGTSNFAQSGSTCSSATPLIAGGTCTAGAKFTPQTTGPLTDTLNLTDNSLNLTGAVQRIALSGTGTSPVPAITAVSPASGPSAGGTSVTITGAGFLGATAVKFGTVAATSFTVNSASSITAVTPAGTPATTVNVSVTTPGGTSATVTADQFTYNPLSAQTITFPQPTTPVVNGAAPVTLTATASSGLAVTYAVTGPATVSGSTLTFTGAGTVSVTANQAGNAAYAAAAPVTDTITVTAAPTSYGAPTEPVGTPSGTQTATVTFATAGTLSAINVLTGGAPNLDFKYLPGTTGANVCTLNTTYAAGAACTVTYSFTPTAPGARLGAIVLAGSGNTLLATEYLNGVGTGAQAVFTPGTQSTLAAGAIDNGAFQGAIDGLGNLYFADRNLGVVKETLSGTTYTRSLLGPSSTTTGVAVDGAGNVYLTAGSSVIEEVLNGSTYTAQTLSLPGVFTPISLAVDGSGDLYVGSTTTVVKETLSGGTYTNSTVATGLSDPYGLALDAAGDVYIANTDGGNVLKETLTSGTYTQSTIAAGLSGAYDLKVDAAGDVYISSGGNILLETYAGGTYTATSLGSFAATDALALDSAGNIFVADFSAGNIDELNRSSSPALTFASTPIGSSTAAQSQSVLNIGNSALSISGVATTTSSFSTDPATTTCTTSGLPTGTTCNAGGKFTPQTTGSLTDTLNLTDNSLNVTGAKQSVRLSGTGTEPVPAVTAVSPASGPSAGGTSVTITGAGFLGATAVKFGTVAATSFTVNSASSITAVTPAGTPATTVNVSVTTPGGTSATVTADQFTYNPLSAQTITFPQPTTPVVNGAAPVTLTATASSGLAVTYAVTGPATVSGSTLTFTGAGTVSVTANQAGNATYAAAAPVTDTITVTAAPTSYGAPTEPVGTPSGTQTATVTFTTDGTLGAIDVLTKGTRNLDFRLVPGGTCAMNTAYVAGNACTVLYSFTPTAPGARLGAITLTTSAGAVLGSSYLAGTGTGPLGVFYPGTHTTIASGFTQDAFPITTDAAGNIYAGTGSGYIYKETPGSNNSYTQSTIGSSLGGFLTQIAVDGAGNVFIADNSNGKLMEEQLNPVTGTYTQSTVLMLPGVFAVTADNSGTLYVGAGGTLYKEVPTGSGTYTQTTIVNGLGSIYAIAVDASGNLYIANESAGLLYRETLSGGTYTPTVIASGLVNLNSAAVDAAGNVYATASSSSNQVLRYAPNGSGGYTPLPSLGVFTRPNGVAVDSKGNLYVTDDGNGRIVEKIDVSDPQTLSFGTVNDGFSSATQTVTLANIGNLALTFTAPASGSSNPLATAGYTVGGSCPQLTSGAGTLGVAATCTDVLTFAPAAGTASGTLTGSLTTTDNNLNGTAVGQVVNLSGVAVNDSPAVTGVSPAYGPAAGGTSVTITGTSFTGATAVRFGTVAVASFTVNSATSITAVAPAGTPAATVNVTVTSPGGTSATGTADTFTYQSAQTITFPQPTTPVVNGTAPVTLTATASSGLPVTYTVTGPATVSGSTLTFTGAGTVTITANQAGNAVYSAAPAVTDTVTVTAAPTSYAAPNTPVGSTSATQTATLTFTASGTLGAISVVTQGATGLDYVFDSGGSCTVGQSYVAGQACTVNYTFSPEAPGQRLGAIVLYNNASPNPSVLGTAFLGGVGTGPLGTFAPGVTTYPITLGLNNPQNAAFDAAGNYYVAGGNSNTVTKYTSAGALVGTLGSGFSYPSDVRVDGAGNVFISDQGNGRVVELPASGGPPVTFATYGVYKIALDAAGFVYYGDATNDRIAKLNPATGSSTTVVAGVYPDSLTLDASGQNLLYIQSGASSVFSVPTAGGTPTAVGLGTTVTDVWGMSTDAANHLYLADTGSLTSGRLLELPATGGTLSVLATLSSESNWVTVLPNGSLSYGDKVNNRVALLDRTTATLTYTPSVAVGSSSAAQAVTLENDGNLPLAISAFATSDSNFTLDPATTTCTPGNAVSTCNVGAKFTPHTVGSPLSDNLNVTDNNLNVAGTVQKATLSGTSTGATATVSVAPVSAPYGTATVNLSATVTFVAGYTPSGAFTFTLNGTTVTAGCTAASSTTETCTYANFPTGTLAGGSYPITGTLAAAGDYATASDNTHSLQVTATAGATVTVSPTAVVSGGTANLSVTVAGTGSTPTGTVTFTMGSSTTTAQCTLVSGACTTTFATTGLATGVTITATYNGDVNYLSATGTNTLTIVPGSFTAPATNVGSTAGTGTSGPLTATLVFNAATTLNSSLNTAIQVVTQGVTGLDFGYVSGGTCLAGANYTAGQSCTVQYSFSPKAPGTRLGAILIYNNAATPAVVSSTLLSGLGNGALVDFAGNTPTTLISGIPALADLKVDAAGNLFYASNLAAGHLYKADSNGKVLTTFPQYYGPVGVAVNGAGDVITYSSGGCCSNHLTDYVGGNPSIALNFGFDTGGQIIASLVVDGAGNFYLPNTHYAAAGYLKLTPNGSGYTESTFLTNQSVNSIAVDSAGNVYAATTTNTLYMVTPSGAATLIPTTGLNNVTGMAVDAAGDVYLASNGNKTVYRIAAGTYTQTTIASGFAPYGIALDGSGNLYLGDATNSRILKITRSAAPAITFGTTAVGASSTAITDTLENDGNLALNFSTLATSVADFTVDAPSTTCSTGTALAAAASCNVGARFTPQSVSPFITGTFNLTDDALNAPGTLQQVALSGPSSVGTATVTMPGVGVPTGGTASLAVMVTGGGVTPTGTVNFTIGSTTVSCTLVAGSCSASFNAAGLPAGPVNVTLLYSGDGNYSPQPGSGTLTVGVGTAVVVVTNTSAIVGGTANLTATITGNGNPPTGTVSFTVGSGAAVSGTCSTTGAVETCTAPDSVAGLTGTAQITASFGGDPNYANTTGTGTLTLVPGSFSAGSLPVATPSGTQTATVVFGTAGTLGVINVLTQGATGLDYAFVSGGTCATGTPYHAGDSCTVQYSFTPSVPGTRLGGITLTDNTGAVLGSSFLTGSGNGALAVMYPGSQSAVITGLGDAFELAADASNNLYVDDFGDSQILKETLSGGVYTQATLGSGFAKPAGIAVDGQGNVFIADQGNGRIVEEVLNIATGAYTQTVPFNNANSGLGNPFGVAVDSTGTVYIGDGGRLLKEVPTGSGYTQTTIDTGFANVTGVAVDSNGDLFLADASASAGAVYEETLSGGVYTRSTIATGLTNANGVFVDASGTVYVTASGNSVLRFVPNPAGGYTQGTPVGGGFGRPNGLTMDSLGNVYVADDPNGGTVYKVDVSDSLSFNFGTTTAVGSTSATQSSTLTNIGNQPLTLSALALSDSTDFSLAGSTCTATGTVAAAATCGISVAFTPQSVGALTGTATSTDNSLNATAAVQALNLSATSLQAAPSVTVLSETIPYGTGTEKLSATVGYSAGLVPSGAFTFTVGSGQPLTASCAPKTSTTEVCTAILTTSGLPVNVYPIVGALAADANYTTLSGNGNLTVTQITPTLTVTPVSILYGATPTTLTVQVAYGGSAAPTGGLTIQVDSGSTLAATCTGTASPLTCTVSYATGTLTATSHTVTANLAADTNYTAATGTGNLLVSATGAAVTVANAQVNAGTPTTTLSATVQFSGAAPTGAFTFAVDNGTAVPATCTASGSNAETCIVAYTTSPFTVGTHTIKGSLAADTNYTATSGQATLTVISVTPVVTVAAPTFAYGSANTTFTAAVAYAASAVPAGVFTFQVDNGAVVKATCTGTSSPLTCTASYPTAAITAGTHTLTGTEAADTTYVSAFGTAVITVDKTTPSLSVAKPAVSYGTQTVTLSATVSFTGAAPTGALTFTVDGGTALTATCTGSTSPETCTASFTSSTLSTGPHTVMATLAADTNYNAISASNTLTITTATPTFTVASPSISYGTATANLSATLAFTGVAPTGNVTFQVDNGTVVKATCTGTASPLTCTAAYTTSALTAGSHTVTASVGADSNYTAASATGTLTVTASAPTLTVASPTVAYGATSVTLSATLAFPGMVPSGALTFTVDNGTPVMATCTGTGSPRTCTVSYPLGSLAAGTHTVTASLAGDSNYSAVSATGTLTLTSTAPTVIVASASVPYGTASTSLSATVAFTGSALPTGALSFTVDSGTAVAGTCTGTTSPVTCTATLPTATLNAGAHTVTASFAGDANYSPAAGTGTLTVTAVAPIITFTVPNHTFGDAPFTVSATSTGTGAFTYTVVSGPATVSGSTVTLTGAGTVVLQATQAASTDYNGGSKQATFTVAQASAVVSVTASATQVNPLQSVTLTATVASTSGATPSGSVTFYDNGVAIGTVPLVNGVASLPTTTLTAGTANVISVSYSGDGNFLPSTSGAGVTVTVGPLDFTFLLSGDHGFTAVPGTVASYNFALAPVYGTYAGTVSFSVTGLPSGATATFSPSSVAISGGAQPVVMSVQVPQSTASNTPHDPFERTLPLLALLFLPALGSRRLRRRLGARALTLLLLVAGLGGAALLTGCGTTKGNGFELQEPHTYTLTVTATSGTLEHSQTVTLTVQ